MKRFVYFILIVLHTACNPTMWSETEYGDIRIVENRGGKNLAYSENSGVELIISKGYAFKDLNRNGKIDKYEDWRWPAEERAKDLASRMTIEQIAGLMLYSGHQSLPAAGRGIFGGTYNNLPYAESGAAPYDLTDQQIKFLTEDNLRHVLLTQVESPEVAARWNNAVQALVEGIGLGIPANNSSDPRHGVVADAEYNYGAGGKISMWPGSLGLAATFDPELVRSFGEMASREYRALGIATALSPQIDLATEPRWNRFSGTFGEDPLLAADMARAYTDGFQTSEGEAELQSGWGYHSVNAMVKHWPGGGPEEGGRDGHFGYGAYAVYPGNNLKDHLYPFVEGAFKLNGKTGAASAVMPYYTISHDQDKMYGENVANGFSKYLIEELLRGKYGYDGVVCTDWLITGNVSSVDVFQGKPWGVEDLSIAERHYKVIMAGVDQFGGNNLSGPVIEAYEMGVAEYGEDFMRQRFEQSAVRLLLNMFRPGLFENPYLNIEETVSVVGNPEYMEAGFNAQLKSVVMLKNQNSLLPLAKGTRVFIPQRQVAASRDWFGNLSPARNEDPVNLQLFTSHFEVVDTPDNAEVAIVFVKSPEGMTGYDLEDFNRGNNGYVPISLQYSRYTANEAREVSLAGGSPFEDFTNRSYKGKSVTASNISDMRSVSDTHRRMKGKPVVVVVNMSNPMVFGEIEPQSSAILAHFQVQDQAILQLLAGEAEPSALLPMQMPLGMSTVEKQKEDVPHDMDVYRDAAGNRYDFGFGLNWSGVINDERVARYKK